ncbi:histidine phosphatase family protein [Paucilactobacillus nenjiangensis]|jgi:probable phosphoglycerate mutase|uniref:histidine phosphatase family protein n=1 Tax=Paucilactobacillus nenjiangensis TaxID=1296540 RepID=UPI003BB04A09
MTKLYFIRHGKTEWNLESRYQGMHGDSPLLPQSYAEIKLLAKSLKGIPFSRLYASPIKRARITAFELVADLKQPIRVSLMNELAEFNLGKMEGMLFSEVEQQYPVEFNAFRNHPDQYDPTAIGAESFPALIRRFNHGIHEILQTAADDENILVVSHGAALNAALNGIVGVPLAHLRDRGGLSNTSTTVLETKNHGQDFKIISWNQTDYLHKEKDLTDTI